MIMTNDTFKPAKHIMLREDEQIRAYTHPTRIVILELLAPEQRTVTSVARALGVHPANITHHFRLLEKTGLIQLVEKRDTGRNLEKYYRATALSFDVDRGTSDIRGKKALALSILKQDLAAAEKSVGKDESKDVLALIAAARIDEKQMKKFMARLEGLVRDFRSADSGKGRAFHMNVSLYPGEIDSLPDKKVQIT
jgi:predicted ArsR family transcriptional regulator